MDPSIETRGASKSNASRVLIDATTEKLAEFVARIVAAPARVLMGPIPPPDAIRDEALRTLLDLMRHSENDRIRSASRVL